MSILLTLILIVALIVAGLVFFAANTARKVEATVPPCGQFVGIDGQRLHYIDTGGAGPAVVLIHGLGGTLWHDTVRAGGQAVGRIPGYRGGSSRLRLFDAPGRCVGEAWRAGRYVGEVHARAGAKAK